MENKFVIRLNAARKSLLAACATVAIAAPLAACLLTMPLAIAPAMAADCGPLKLISNVALLAEQGGSPRLLVPVTLDGTPRKMLLATGGAASTLTEAAAKALNLHPLESDHMQILNNTGDASTRYVTTGSFQMGQLLGKGMDFMLNPNRDAGTDGAFDGTLAGDLMSHYDVEIDFAAHKMFYFLPDHCDGQVPHWPASAVAVVPFKTGILMTRFGGPIRTLRLAQIVDPHIRVPVTLDGKTFLAVIDTAAARSTMSAKTARIAFGLTAASPGSVSLGMIGDDPKNEVFGHVFQSLSFDGITVSKPYIAITPDLIGSRDPYNSMATGSNIHHVDDGLGSEVTIGMDVLKSLNLYIAYHEKKLYITAAGAAASPTASTARAGASSAPR